jgi:hypothetical protein
MIVFDPVTNTGEPMSEVPMSEWRQILQGVEGHATPAGHMGLDTEMRVTTNELVALLGAPNGFVTWARIGKIMRSLGWEGPVVHRVRDVTSRGYRRPAPGSEPPKPAEQTTAVPAVETPASVKVAKRLAITTEASVLARKLEHICDLSLDKIEEVLQLPLDPRNGNAMRAITACASVAIQSQLRADETRLRSRQSSDVLERLAKLVRAERKNLPKRAPVSPQTPAEA